MKISTVSSLLSRQQAESTSMLIVADIETGAAAPEDLQKLVDGWKPGGNLKNPETIEQHRQKFVDEITLESAKTDAAPIVCCAIRTNRGHREIFSCLPKLNVLSIHDYELIEAGSETEMLDLLVFRLNELAYMEEARKFVGHNLKAFDLVKIRNRCGRNGVKLPPALRPYAVPVFDTMENAKHYSVDLAKDKTKFVSFEMAALYCGFDTHKRSYSGAQVPKDVSRIYELLAQDPESQEAKELTETILLYNTEDVEGELDLAVFMAADQL